MRRATRSPANHAATDVPFAHLRPLAHPLRLRITRDAEGFPLIPGRYGQIEWFDGQDLAVYSDHPRVFGKLWAIPGVRRHQTGDQEMRAIFPPEALPQVAAVIRAKRWGGGAGTPSESGSRPRTNGYFSSLGMRPSDQPSSGHGRTWRMTRKCPLVRATLTALRQGRRLA